jgi:hypothetical protein
MPNRDLTPAEKAKPYAKYFYAPPAAPEPRLAKCLEQMTPMDPAKALPLESINDLLNPGYFEVEDGYCVLPNGAGYVAVHTTMPGVTAEMIDWWPAWYGMEDLRYKLWWPKAHYGVSIRDEDRRKKMDPNVPVVQKYRGMTHHVREDIGEREADIWLSFVSPEEFGFDPARFHAPNVATAITFNISMSPIGAPADVPKGRVAGCHFIRNISGGIEYRSRFWMGYNVDEAQPRLMLAPGAKLPESAAAGLFIHCIEEFGNLRSFLPQLYREQKDNWA